MDEYTKTIISVGELFEERDDTVVALAHTIPRSYFDDLTERRFDGFEFMCNLPLSEALNYIKGLVLCEEEEISPYPGSTSLVIWAFRTLRERRVEEWASIAVWIVANHDNPYSPFNFRRTRDHWNQAMEESSDPSQIARRVVRMEHDYNANKLTKAREHDIKTRISKLHKEVAPEDADLRQRMIEEMERQAGWPE